MEVTRQTMEALAIKHVEGASLPRERIARLFLCCHDGVLVVLHGFIKKTQKTPTDDLSLARRRMMEVMK